LRFESSAFWKLGFGIRGSLFEDERLGFSLKVCSLRFESSTILEVWVWGFGFGGSFFKDVSFEV
jgi:hypothetical protein